MWMAKVAIIMYLFSTCLLFSGYYVDLAFGENLFSSVTYSSLDALIDKNDVDEDISIDLVFGDFLAGANVVFGIITGDTISGAFGSLPNFDEVWMILIRILFTLSSAALWVYIIASRVL